MKIRLVTKTGAWKTTSWSIGIGVVTLLIAMLSLPTLSEADVLCDIITLGHCKPFGREELPDIPLTCTRPSMQGLPVFLKQPRGAARYRFGGTCQSPQAPGKQLTYRWEGSWTPSERNAQKPNASEAVEITGYEPFPAFRDRAPGGRISMYWTARCTRDPWLQSANCRRLGAYIPADLRQGVPDLLSDSESFPVTRQVISPRDRQRLLAEYKRVNPPPVARPLTTGKGVLTAYSETPKIKRPSSGERILQGQLVVQIDPPRVGGSAVTELEFKWLDTPSNRTTYVNAFAVATSKLVQGYVVDPRVTQAQTGRWEVRARVSGQKTPRPWSPATPFLLALTSQQQTQSNTKSAPGSSIFQTPKTGVQTGSQIYRPQTSPANKRNKNDTIFRPLR